MTNIIKEQREISDADLHKMCRLYGARAVEWRRRFLGLLPEVNRRRLWEVNGFSSVYEFAAKLCGVSPKLVQRVLQVEARFEDKPELRELLVSGKVSVHKLARVASIATQDDEEFWAAKAKILPKKALETMIRDVRWEENQTGEVARGKKSVPGHTPEDELGISGEVREKLMRLKNKGININELLIDLLDQREEDIKQEKNKIAANQTSTKSRYIPVNVRNVMEKEHGYECSVDSCHKKRQVIHHSQRFGLAKRHDPRYMAPLCKEHHTIAHTIDSKFTRKAFLQRG